MIKSKEGTTRVIGDIAEVLSDFAVIANSIYKNLLKEVDEEDATTMIIEHCIVGLMSEKEFKEYMQTNDASEKAAKIFETYNKTREKMFN